MLLSYIQDYVNYKYKIKKMMFQMIMLIIE